MTSPKEWAFYAAQRCNDWEDDPSPNCDGAASDYWPCLECVEYVIEGAVGEVLRGREGK